MTWPGRYGARSPGSPSRMSCWSGCCSWGRARPGRGPSAGTGRVPDPSGWAGAVAGPAVGAGGPGLGVRAAAAGPPGHRSRPAADRPRRDPGRAGRRMRAAVPPGPVPPGGRAQHRAGGQPSHPGPAAAGRHGPGGRRRGRASPPDLTYPPPPTAESGVSLMSRTQITGSRPGSVSRALARGRLGVPAVLFFVLTGVAPLTVAAGGIPTAYATTGLTGIPATFLLVGGVGGVWATGYVPMPRHITNAGAFYALIARGLGRPAGVAAAMVALVAYSFLQVGLYGAFGPNAASEASAHLHLHAAWWVWALAAWAVITVLGLVRVDITGKVLGVLLSAEIIVILAETIAGLARPEGGHLSFAVLSPAALTSAGSGTIGVLAVVAVLGFVGFQQAPVLAEEARHPRRTIPVATYLALGAIAVVYTGAAWAMTAHTGQSHVVAAAAAQGPGLLFSLDRKSTR